MFRFEGCLCTSVVMNRLTNGAENRLGNNEIIGKAPVPTG